MNAPPAQARLVSLDALRGFDMFWILGADALVHALRRMSDSGATRFLANQLEHKPWDGFAFYDLIFPLFVFIVGVSSVFSLTKILEQHGRRGAVKRILIRAAVLFLLGIFYNGGLAREWPDIRIVGVLQRIAIAYAATGLLFCFFKPKALIAICAAILVGYWGLMAWVPIRDFQLDRRVIAERYGAAPVETPDAKPALPSLERVRELYDTTSTYVKNRYEPGLNVAHHFDFNYLPGRKYQTYWDPEGWLSNLPAIATCLLGVFAGLWLRRGDLPGSRKVAGLALGGVAALAAGHVWGFAFPIVKDMWTSSFVLVACGWSFLLLALFYHLVDVRQWRGWCAPFVWIGVNPITLYLLTSVVSFTRIAQRLVGGDIAQFFDATVAKGFGDLVVTLTGLALIVLLARFLHHRRIFLRV